MGWDLSLLLCVLCCQGNLANARSIRLCLLSASPLRWSMIALQATDPATPLPHMAAADLAAVVVNLSYPTYNERQHT